MHGIRCCWAPHCYTAHGEALAVRRLNLARCAWSSSNHSFTAHHHAPHTRMHMLLTGTSVERTFALTGRTVQFCQTVVGQYESVRVCTSLYDDSLDENRRNAPPPLSLNEWTGGGMLCCQPPLCRGWGLLPVLAVLTVLCALMMCHSKASWRQPVSDFRFRPFVHVRSRLLRAS